MRPQQDRRKIREALATLAAAHADAVAQTQRAIEQLATALEQSPALQGEAAAGAAAGRRGPRADRSVLRLSVEERRPRHTRLRVACGRQRRSPLG